MNRITVQPSGPDRRVPLENSGDYFEQGVPREVYRTRYIDRRLLDADLVEVDARGKPVTTQAESAPVAPVEVAQVEAAPAELEGDR